MGFSAHLLRCHSSHNSSLWTCSHIMDISTWSRSENTFLAFGWFLTWLCRFNPVTAKFVRFDKMEVNIFLKPCWLVPRLIFKLLRNWYSSLALLSCLWVFFIYWRLGLRKKMLFCEKKAPLPNWIIWLTEHLPQDMLQIFVVFYLVRNLLENVYIHSLSNTRVNPHSAGIDFSRQNLTSVDVRFWRLKSIPAL